MPTNFYDVLVIGDDLAGLITAALCARRGMRVLVAETHATPPERYTIGPFTLPRTPTPFIGESSPAIRRVIAELNFIQLLKRRLAPLRPAFQVVLPDARLEISADGDGMGRDLLRELGGEREAVETFLARAGDASKVLEQVLGQDVTFPPDGFWERREIAPRAARLPAPDEDLLPGVPAGHRARALLALPAAFSTSSDPRTMSPTAVSRAFDLWRRGTSRLEGGRDSLRQMLLEKLRTHAGEVRVIEPSSVVTKWNRAQGIALVAGEILGCQHMVCAAPIADFGDLFGDKRPKRILAAQKELLPTAYRYVLNLVISGAGIPEGISPITLCVRDPGQPLVGDNAFAVHLGEPDDDARVVATIVANVPAPGDNENLDDLMAALRPRLLARLEELMPFYDEHLLLVHSPNQGRPPEGTAVSEADAKVKHPAVPPEALWSSTIPASLGVGGLPYDIGVKGIVTANSQNLLGLGLEGDFAAGWCAARIISGAAGKKKDYLKDEVLLGT